MSDKEVPFFNPSDVLSLGGDWVVQDNGLADSNQRAQGLKANGDEAASQLYDGKTAGTIKYECFASSGNLVLPNVGSVMGGYHIDSISLTPQATGWPQLTVTVHQHDDNAHVDGDFNEYAPSIVFPAGYGIPRTLALVATGTAFSLDDTDAGMRGMTYTLGCQHQDEPDGSGNHLAGQNRDGVETLAVEFTKDPAVVTVAAGWDEMSDGSPKSNTAAETASMQWEHHITREV